MKAILVVLLLLLTNVKTVDKVTVGKELGKIKKVEINFEAKMEAFHISKYEEVIEILKEYEGFSATLYDDGGYMAIGYGQRVEFFSNFNLKSTITRERAEEVLKLSFANHLQLANYFFPGLNRLQQYSVAHMSYTCGIGNVIKYGYLYKTEDGWKINKHNLYNARKVDSKPNYRAIREYEYKLFNL
jgi:GH24 family phage-related lysozyme (muramidase)